jgi:hypothetical protein
LANYLKLKSEGIGVLRNMMGVGVGSLIVGPNLTLKLRAILAVKYMLKLHELPQSPLVLSSNDMDGVELGE